MERAVGAELDGLCVSVGWVGVGGGGGPRHTLADRDPPCSVCFFFFSPLVPYSLSCPPDPQSEEDLSGQSSEIPKVWQV